jgi:hypothetical protein
MSKFILIHKNGEEQILLSKEDVIHLNGLAEGSFFCFYSVNGTETYIRKKDIIMFRSTTE